MNTAVTMNFSITLWLMFLAIFECCWRTYSLNAPKEVKAEVETNLKNLFGFKQWPKIDKSKVVIPKAMLELYEKQTGFSLETASIPRKGWHTRSANTVRSFTHIESPVDERFTTHHKFRLKFDVTTVPKQEQVKAAELIISRQKVHWLSEQTSDKDHYQKVLVHAILKPGKKGKHGPFTTVIDSKMVDIRENTSLSFDVLPAVERWLDDPKSNHGVLITVMGVGKNKSSPAHHVRLKRNVEESQSKWNNAQPILLTYTDDGKNKQKTGMELTRMQRRRRATRKHGGRRQDKREPCSRHKMYVDFADVGWNDWIVAPPGYDAYYCHGECNFPLAEHLNTTNHAIVQTFMNSVNPAKVPKSCCVPTSLTVVSMLYLDDEGKVVLKNYKDMAVIGCGCR